MKEKPILFSAPMVRAILDGSKTQTRRITKKQPFQRSGRHDHRMEYVSGRAGNGDEIDGFYAHTTCAGGNWWECCAYGQPGNQLWVRETFFAYGRWVTRYSEKKKRDEWHFIDMTVECDRAYQYAADNPGVPVATSKVGVTPGWYKRPAIFMPRKASRIQLEITGMRVERLSNISEADAVAEGIKISSAERRSSTCYGIYECQMPDGKTHFSDSAYELYRKLWESINGAGSWEKNPWVWVIEFKRVKP